MLEFLITMQFYDCNWINWTRSFWMNLINLNCKHAAWLIGIYIYTYIAWEPVWLVWCRWSYLLGRVRYWFFLIWRWTMSNILLHGALSLSLSLIYMLTKIWTHLPPFLTLYSAMLSRDVTSSTSMFMSYILDF